MFFLYPEFYIIAAENENDSYCYSLSFFPILMYDSDIGFGLGGKGVMKDRFQIAESFDLILFASTKGEQWYVFGFSLPDAEIRQGTQYSLALDLKLEFDKLLKSNYFGIGNDTENNDFQFPKEFTKLRLSFSRTFAKHLIVELAGQFTHYSVYDFKPEWQTISPSTPGSGETAVYVLVPMLSYDTRNSQINPQSGCIVKVQNEITPGFLGAVRDHWNFTKLRLELNSYYTVLHYHIIAHRIWVQKVEGKAPYQELSALGGGWTARGYKADRFLDKAMVLTSLEYRFPLYQALGGVIFFDTGRVGYEVAKLRFIDWHSDWGTGLRYYLKDFVVRLDAGFSSEGTRIFLNFGQVF
jgi:outer membrane protein assembly factor BamA